MDRNDQKKFKAAKTKVSCTLFLSMYDISQTIAGCFNRIFLSLMLTVICLIEDASLIEDTPNLQS